MEDKRKSNCYLIMRVRKDNCLYEGKAETSMKGGRGVSFVTLDYTIEHARNFYLDNCNDNEEIVILRPVAIIRKRKPVPPPEPFEVIKIKT